MRIRITTLAWLMAAACNAPRVSGDQLLVTSFSTDLVAHFDIATQQHRGMLHSDGTGLDGPLAAKIGPDDLLYVTSEGSNQVQRYNWRTGAFVDNFVTGGAEGLDGPTGIAWDANGDLYVASFGSDAVYKYHGATGVFLQTVVSPGQVGLNGPDNGMTFGPDGKLYIPGYFSNQIVRFDPSTNITDVFIPNIGLPRVLVFHDNQWFITSEATDAVRRYDLNGSFLNNFIRPGPNVLNNPIGLAYADDAWYVTSGPGDKVLKFGAQGQLIDANFIPSGLGGLDSPTFVTIVVPEPGSTLLLWTLVGLPAWRRR